MATLLQESNATNVAIQIALAIASSSAIPNKVWLPDVKRQITDMVMHESSIRDTAQKLHISTTTVIEELKKGFNLNW